MSFRIVIADDHEVVRVGVKSMLADTDFVVIAEATTGAEAVRQVLELRPDVVVLDVRMVNCDGLTALGQIRQHLPDLPVLMLSNYDNPTYVARAVALGANGYLLKGTSASQLLGALRTLVSGETIWSKAELRSARGTISTGQLDDGADIRLTEREVDVLGQMALGLTNKEIGMALSISYETVKEHVQHILRKLGVSDRTQAAVWAVRRGLV